MPERNLAKGGKSSDDIECPVCGTIMKSSTTECPECGELLEDVLVLDEESGRGRASRIIFRVGLIIFLLGFLVLMYTFLHDGMGNKYNIPSLIPGYEAYNVFGYYNWLVLYVGVTVMIVGIILMVVMFIINRVRTRERIIIEETEPDTPAQSGSGSE